jgi:fibronectin type 3 domain-containing protein
MLSWPAVSLLANGRPISGRLTYNVYRESPGTGFQLVNTSPVLEAKFQDITVANDVSYRYLVRTVREVGSTSLESLDSPAQIAKPVDQTPPAPVLNLVAVSTAKGIELRWEAGREPDLAGYRVFRRSLAEPQFRLLNSQLVKAPYFIDSETAQGVTYYYYVAAVDNSRRANQSLPSETVEVTR